MGRHKRQTGGQPGNQNARKHGFYAANLTVQETIKFYRLLSHEGADPALAVIRMKMEFILHNAPGNRRLLREVTGLLYKYCRSNFNLDRLDKENAAELKQFVRDFKAAVVEKGALPELIEAES